MKIKIEKRKLEKILDDIFLVEESINEIDLIYDLFKFKLNNEYLKEIKLIKKHFVSIRKFATYILNNYKNLEEK